MTTNPFTINRRNLLKLSVATAGISMLPKIAFAKSVMTDWSKPFDVASARREAAIYTTYGMPDTWANYGEVLSLMAKKYDYSYEHVDTDMGSMQEILKYDAEKNNPVAISSDIGILFGPVADERKVVPPYMPPSASKLPNGLKGKEGGWVATFTGVPAMIVNTDVIKNVPESWEDLLKPEYKGKVSAIDASGMGGTDMATFIAWAYAFGGSETDLAPGAEFARKLLNQMSSAPKTTQTLERGELPIQLKYDFNCIAQANALKAKGVNTRIIIPQGTIYAPSATMINRYNVEKMNIAKVFLDFVLSDEAQIAFAKFGARPIRWVLGDLELPAEARKDWLPDEQYAHVHQIKDWSKVDVKQVAQFWVDEVVGG